MKILLAVDGSDGSDAAVREVARRPWPPGSEIKLVSAADPVLRSTPETWSLSAQHYQDVDQAARDAAQEALDKAALHFSGGVAQALKVSTEILAGPPARAILDEAERWRADLVVLGSRGLGSLERFLLGSVSKEVALDAKCSVEIVREHEG